MKPVRTLRSGRIFAASILFAVLAIPPLPVLAQAPVQPLALDVSKAQQALQLQNEGKLKEALALFEAIPRDHPTSPLIPESTFRAGYIHFMLGDHDRSVGMLRDVATKLKSVPPNILELASAMIPQVLTAKAAKLEPGNPGRKAALEDAIQQFDAFIKGFPQSPEVETTTYQKAVAQYQLEKFDDAVTALRGNLQRFPQSPTILDSQYLLALTLGTLANLSAQKATAQDKTADANYDESERLLREIINKRSNYALVSDSAFQVGELLFARSSSIENKEQQAKVFASAMDAYRYVLSKEAVISGQTAYVASLQAGLSEKFRAGGLPGRDKHQRLIDREREKLNEYSARADQTITAKIKVGQIFFEQGNDDAARVVFNFVKPYAENDEQKKQLAYFIALTYGRQELSGKAVAAYEAFRTAYPKDPIAENLGLVVGGIFVKDDPTKALTYFKQNLEDYPTGRFQVEAMTQQAAALQGLQRYDEALKMYQETLTKSTNKEVLAAADFGIATILMETGKGVEAVAAFRKVRDTYSGLPQAENAGFYVGDVLLGIDPKSAAVEFQSFVKKFDKSELMPTVMTKLAQAQQSSGQAEAAVATWKDLAAKFPDTSAAHSSYFERAKMLNDAGKRDEVIALMRQFIQKYPEAKPLYSAHDFLAQILANAGKGEEAIATYEDFIKARPQDPGASMALLKISAAWKAMADGLGKYIALNDGQRATWNKSVETAMNASERVVTDYSESPEVAIALKYLLDLQKMRKVAKILTSEEEIEKYFQDFAKRFEKQPATRSKVMFTLGSYTFEKDKAKAIKQMSSVYDPSLKYAAADLDLYGEALIEQKKLDEAMAVYEKLAVDYPVPAGGDPTKAGRDTQEAQAISLFGVGKVFQERKNFEEAKKRYDELEKLYAWSTKMQEANYGIGVSLKEQKSYEEALKRLNSVTRSQTATPLLRANSMLATAQVNEAQGDYDLAIDNYIKIKSRFAAINDAAAEGLWRGAQLLERQGAGEIPSATPVPKATPRPKGTPAPAAEGAKATPAKK